MDVSADLHELTRCPVGLVSAGVKSILDIGRYVVLIPLLAVHSQDARTLEYLVSFHDAISFNICILTKLTQETLGVPVVSYGETRDFPAFFSRKSGFTVSTCWSFRYS